jgi:hypothetical protein
MMRVSGLPHRQPDAERRQTEPRLVNDPTPRRSGRGYRTASSGMSNVQREEMHNPRTDQSAVPYRVKLRGPQTTATTATTKVTIRLVMRGSQCEPWIGNSCQQRFITS